MSRWPFIAVAVLILLPIALMTGFGAWSALEFGVLVLVVVDHHDLLDWRLARLSFLKTNRSAPARNRVEDSLDAA